VVPAVSLLLLALTAAPASAVDARTAVEAFVSRLTHVSLADMTVTESFTLYDPDGRSEQASGERRLFVKIPRRERVEEILEGRRVISILLDGRMWVRRSDGSVSEAPPVDAQRARADLLTSFRHTAADLLGVWRSLGIRDDVVHDERAGGRLVIVIGARPGDRASPAVWLDPEYGVIRLVWREKLPAREGVVDLALSDHRRVVSDFFYPFRREIFLDGRLLTRVTIRDVAVNTNLPDDLFDPAALRRTQ
jgi:hypothetical protein